MTIEFINLYELLRTRGIETGTLATAIEQVGIYGWDRYGRFKQFSHDSLEAAPAFDALAAHAKPYEADDMPPIDLDDGTGIYYSYGWPANELPNFAAIESEQPPEPEKRKVNTKTENSTLAIVGGLLLTIRGELEPVRNFVCEA